MIRALFRVTAESKSSKRMIALVLVLNSHSKTALTIVNKTYSILTLKLKFQVLREDKSDNATFQDYGVEPGDEISVLVVLCDIPLDIRDVCFELSWGYPEHENDVLDGSVFMYAGIEFKGIVHHKQCKSQCCGAVQHSGEQHLDDDTRRGFQEIPINLTTMDPSVDRLFLTLSALNSPSICSFKQLSLKVYDKRYPDIMLCTEATVTEDDLKKTIDFWDVVGKFSIMTKKSLIMYCLRKTCDSWEVLIIKKLSKGNLEEYTPIQESIEKLIKKDLKICAKSSRIWLAPGWRRAKCIWRYYCWSAFVAMEINLFHLECILRCPPCAQFRLW